MQIGVIGPACSVVVVLPVDDFLIDRRVIDVRDRPVDDNRPIDIHIGPIDVHFRSIHVDVGPIDDHVAPVRVDVGPDPINIRPLAGAPVPRPPSAAAWSALIGIESRPAIGSLVRELARLIPWNRQDFPAARVRRKDGWLLFVFS
jgi:hypothetical protein